MNAGETVRVSIHDCRAVRLGLASPQDILNWSCGEVQKAETVNYRTGRPVAGGLFCERIFGPERDWECGCGRLRGMKYRGTTCEHCQVEVNHSRVRRKRMGHIELAAPVVHIWFFKVQPSCLANLFDLSATALSRIIYYHEYVVIDPGSTDLDRFQRLDEEAYRQARARHGEAFMAGMGAEAIVQMLQALDLDALARELRQRVKALAGAAKVSEERQRKLVRRLKIVDGLLRSGNRPEWMVLRRLPVLPPDLRPLVRLDSGAYATSDLNDLYRRILHRNTRLQKLQEMQAPEIILCNEKRLLQQAVDALFDNNRLERPVSGSSRRPLKSLSDMIQGKQGRFRENLLGKRVDYSARSVIVVGPELKLHQCGLPKAIALELFQPFLIHRLREAGLAQTIKRARDLIRQRDERIWDLLEEVMRDRPVLLNRAPTLHRMGIQAFEPVLIEGNAIRLHPLVCKGFNADFDGDQMAVHLPLSTQAKVEASVLLMAANNIFSPANGKPIITPTQDIVLGCYYLTAAANRDEARGPEKVFHAPAEVIRAFADNKIGIHARIQVRLPIARKVVGEVAVEKQESGVGELPRLPHGRIATTVGRVLFNDYLPAPMPFYDLPLTVGNLSRIIADAHALLGRACTITLLDRIKEIGFRWATRSGVSFATADLLSPAGKARVLHEQEKEIDKLQEQYERGNITARGRSHRAIELWGQAHQQIGDELMTALAEDRRRGEPSLNPIHVMSHSGARGSREQVRQLAGMRGLMARPSGEIIETPIKANFREGLSVLDYFRSTHGARKGLADTALKTADSGYLTRKLADVALNVVVTMHDCRTIRGARKKVADQGRALVGRVSLTDVTAPGEEPIVRAGEMIAATQTRRLADLGFQEVLVRSPTTCEAARGVCRLCYGMDRSTGALVEEGLAVGIIAAQSIGEPATQLTLRTFHLGGTATLAAEGSEPEGHRPHEGGRTQDITAGLPRVIEVFEAQRSRRSAVLAEVSGLVRVGGEHDKRRGRQVVFLQPLDDEDRPTDTEHAQAIPSGHELRVGTGDRVEAGEPLTDGPIAAQDVLRIGGREAVQDFLLEEAQKVYRAQGVDVDDKHLEVIIARMLRKVRVKSAGDTDLLPGSVLDRFALREVNRRLNDCLKIKAAGASRFQPSQLVPRKTLAEERARLKAAGLELPKVVRPRAATCVELVLGVSRAALQADSFLAAASFQETSKVLMEAALAGRVDELSGLKENVLLGHLIPAGTGYRTTESLS